MKNILLLVSILLVACSQKKETVDILVTNANIYTVSDSLPKASAFAIKDGMFVAIGESEEIKNKYQSNQVIDAEGKPVYPGLIDAHCHFLGMGLVEQKVRLEGTKSYEEVLEVLVDFQKKNQLSYITGRGWDQNDWEVKEYPTNEKLDSLFPTTPVAIRRVDGHALLANQAAIDLAGVTIDTPASGGEILKKDGKLTGVFIDAPMELIRSTIPKPTIKESAQALKLAAEKCFSLGLTTVNEAGLERYEIKLMDSLQQANELKMRIYAMASASKENLDYYLKKGIYKTDYMNVRSFKYYGDGALGSRGAVMKEPYSDLDHHHGALIFSVDNLKETARRIANSDFQMNTHAIGDSTNYIVLKTYKEALEGKEDRRWKIEHAQIVDEKDFHFFDKIVPSIQPTHATSDMYWAEDRVGKERIKNGYAYKKLLNNYGKVALGTDFPVEKVNPMLTFYAAVARKDLKGYPENGYQMENALTREETLKGMTIWAAHSNFEEQEKGSIEIGKFADFVILDRDIMTVDINEVPEAKVLKTFIGGELVYEKK
ncbi:amidohydrolase [Pseudofulvibacter geojedonensis]|uniref:Amidohydrolase n=1 Tax=Pseudofulvibacter geojedonensis TaxID=1123758 RepID=A0ABW3HYP7_9FLAO